MEERNCLNCFNLRTLIPLIHKSNSILLAQLDYKKAMARCSWDHLANEKGETRIFKNLFIKKTLPKLKVFEEGKRCLDFIGE